MLRRQAATPTFLPVAGTYTSAQSVTISDATSGATIYYTTNGTTPTTGSTVYSSSSPIAVSSSETIEAIAVASGYSNSAVASAAYVINLPGFGPPSGSQPGAISIQPGATTGNTATISVVGTNGFSGTVNLTCSITPVAANDPPTCTLSPPSVTLSGTTTQTSTLTVTTTPARRALLNRPEWQAGWRVSHLRCPDVCHSAQAAQLARDAGIAGDRLFQLAPPAAEARAAEVAEGKHGHLGRNLHHQGDRNFGQHQRHDHDSHTDGAVRSIQPSVRLRPSSTSW